MYILEVLLQDRHGSCNLTPAPHHTDTRVLVADNGGCNSLSDRARKLFEEEVYTVNYAVFYAVFRGTLHRRSR